MRVGLQLHQERGIEAVLGEASAADRQGFSTVWLYDHLANPFGADVPEGPFDSFTLMTAIATATQRTRLAWAMLNLSFRHPAVLAKMLATLDHLSRGRVICSVGAGWFLKEYEAYGIPLLDDHDERVAYGREVIRLIKLVWTHPAPETVDFDGEFVQIRNLSFSPAPYSRPHPPIWVGGESEATLSTVRELADGWVMLTSGTRDRLAELTGAPDWPARPLDLVRNVQIHVAPTSAEALEDAAAAYSSSRSGELSFEDYVAREVVGTPDECAARLRELERWGITEVRVTCVDLAQQERIATMILPRL